MNEVMAYHYIISFMWQYNVILCDTGFLNQSFGRKTAQFEENALYPRFKKEVYLLTLKRGNPIGSSLLIT